MVRLKKIIYSLLIASTTLALFKTSPIQAQELLHPRLSNTSEVTESFLSSVMPENNTIDEAPHLGLGDLVDYAKYKLFTDIDLASLSDITNTTNQNQAPNQLLLTTPGLYRLSGTLTNQSLVIDLASDESIGLIMQGVTIANTQQTSIEIKQAKAVDLFIPSEQSLTIYQQASLELTATIQDGTQAADEISAITTSAPLRINNQGEFNLINEQGKGIEATAAVNLVGGNYYLNTQQTAISTTKDLEIQQANLNIQTEQTALVAMDEKQSGNLTIQSSSLDLNYGQSAMQIGEFFSMNDTQLTTKQLSTSVDQVQAQDESMDTEKGNNYFTVTSEMNI